MVSKSVNLLKKSKSEKEEGYEVWPPLPFTGSGIKILRQSIQMPFYVPLFRHSVDLFLDFINIFRRLLIILGRKVGIIDVWWYNNYSGHQIKETHDFTNQSLSNIRNSDYHEFSPAL